jgi:CubicO group peptidase (beta-lactamase class C family)
MKWIAALVGLVFLATGAAAATPGVDAAAERLLGGAVRDHRASAAVLAQVVDGQIVAISGWGTVAGSGSARVDPATTRFPIASITKTMTAIAVARLVSEGRIRSLDDPANRYLKRFRLPDGKHRPISIRDLLTHRSGLDDTNFGLYRPRNASAYPLPGSAYTAIMPRPVAEPGQWPAYSNYGVAVLGALIEDVSGQTFADYVTGRIFSPLGMSGALLPTRPGTPRNLIVPQDLTDPSRPVAMPVHPDSLLNLPSGGAIATAQDMALYMQALVSSAEVPGVLDPAATAMLFTPMARVHPALSGNAMLFETQPVGPITLFKHGGTTEGVWCEMFLVREARSGLFFCMTDWWHGRGRILPADRPGITLGLVSAFLAQIAGPEALAQAMDAPPPVKASATDTAALSGYYVSARSFRKSSAAVLSIFNPNAIAVASSADGLTIGGTPGFAPVAPGLFRGSTPELFAFVPDGKGGHVLARQFRPDAYLPARWIETPHVAAGMIASGLALLVLATALSWAAGAASARTALIATIAAFGVLVAALQSPLPGLAPLMEGYFKGEAARFHIAAAAGGVVAAAGLVAALLLARRWSVRPRLIRPAALAALAGTSALTVVLAELHLLGLARL